MKHISLFLTLTLACLSPNAESQPNTYNRGVNAVAAARKQTALAIRAIATPDDAVVLAELGDFDSARKLAARQKTQREWSTTAIARLAAEAALSAGDYKKADAEIAHASDTMLWLKLSKRYYQLNRKADAKRTAYCAVNQVRRKEQDVSYWGEVTVWLCELGEPAAARRLLMVAKQELLDGEPLLGSPMDRFYEVAAECRFDDIIPDPAGVFGWPSLVRIYTSQNRDEMARRTIERALNGMVPKAPNGKQISELKSSKLR